jgi:hypothetical protein
MLFKEIISVYAEVRMKNTLRAKFLLMKNNVVPPIGTTFLKEL